MNVSWRWWGCCLAAVICCVRGAGAADGMQAVELTVDGAQRSALVYVPPGAAGHPLPVVFAFHGHGGNSSAAARKFQVDRLWPQAISVYPQGLNTPGGRIDPEGTTPGWQKAEGEQGDRDLKFFDALLAYLEKNYSVDPKRIYATGHSNGGGFTYLLWAARPQVFAAVAVCSGGGGSVARITQPKPALIMGGRADEIVPFDRQEASMDAIRKLDACAANGQPWQGSATLYPSAGGTPVATYVYNGGHAMDEAEPGLIVKFFQEH